MCGTSALRMLRPTAAIPEEIHLSVPLRAALLATAVALGASGPALAAEGSELRCGTAIASEEAHRVVWAPEGNVFCPLVADPKAIRSFATYLNGKFPTSAGTISVGSIGIADGFGFFRIGGKRAGDGLQLGVEAAVFAQFQLHTSSHDLLNADYFVSFPLTLRLDGFSARTRIGHQSSHLGDELLTRPESTIRRQNLSFEFIELMLSQEVAFVRVYAGGEYLFDRTPNTLAPALAHVGTELRHGLAPGVRLVAALDVKLSEQQDWNPAWSVRAGAEFAWSRSEGHRLRVWSFLLEYYEGPSPYGQFFLDSTRYLGAGFHFQL